MKHTPHCPKHYVPQRTLKGAVIRPHTNAKPSEVKATLQVNPDTTFCKCWQTFIAEVGAKDLFHKLPEYCAKLARKLFKRKMRNFEYICKNIESAQDLLQVFKLLGKGIIDDVSYLTVGKITTTVSSHSYKSVRNLPDVDLYFMHTVLKTQINVTVSITAEVAFKKFKQEISFKIKQRLPGDAGSAKDMLNIEDVKDSNYNAQIKLIAAVCSLAAISECIIQHVNKLNRDAELRRKFISTVSVPVSVLSKYYEEISKIAIDPVILQYTAKHLQRLDSNIKKYIRSVRKRKQLEVEKPYPFLRVLPL